MSPERSPSFTRVVVASSSSYYYLDSEAMVLSHPQIQHKLKGNALHIALREDLDSWRRCKRVAGLPCCQHSVIWEVNGLDLDAVKFARGEV